MLGLAVGIDYALFIINRHRRQLVDGYGVGESIALATGTSGNAVVFAGSTVVIALLALNVTGIPFLGLMGTVGAACVAIAVLIAVTLTPALLSLGDPRAPAQRGHPPRQSVRAGARRARQAHGHPNGRRPRAAGYCGRDARRRRGPRGIHAPQPPCRHQRGRRDDPASRLRDRCRQARRRRERSVAGRRRPPRFTDRGRGARLPGEGRHRDRWLRRCRRGRADRDLRRPHRRGVPGRAGRRTDKRVDGAAGGALRAASPLDGGITLGVAGQATGNIDISQKLADALPPPRPGGRPVAGSSWSSSSARCSCPWW